MDQGPLSQASVSRLDRLLALNHERYADEVRQGLHEPKGGKKKTGHKGKKKASSSSPSPLFGDQG